MIRWVRHGSVAGRWRPWWLLGLVEVVTYPQPRYQSYNVTFLPGMRAFEDFEARPARMVPTT
jgi:hypothetical protein